MGQRNKMNEHPLKSLLDLYISEYENDREEHLDLSSLQFHRTRGLTLTIPQRWPLLEVLNSILEESSSSKVVMIFSTAAAYRELFNVFDDRVEYISWYEIFTGMQVASTDIRHIQRIKTILSQADLTFFIDPPSSLHNVTDQVRGYTENCLVVIGRENE